MLFGANVCSHSYGCLEIAFPCAKMTLRVTCMQRCSHQKTKPKKSKLGKRRFQDAKLDCAEREAETDTGGPPVSGQHLPGPRLPALPIAFLTL